MAAVMAAEEEKQCMICMDTMGDNTYTIKCNSRTPHQICNDCESDMRIRAPITANGRFITCPLCRTTETSMNPRSQASWDREVKESYKLLVPIHRRLDRGLEPLRRQIRVQNEEIRLLRETNREFQDLFQFLNIGPRPVPEHLPIPPPAPPPALLPVPIPPAPVVRAAQAGLRPLKSWCESGRRELRTCTTANKTQRVCSFPTCTKFVCRSCKQCTTH